MSDYPLSLPRDLGPFVIFQYPQTASGAPFLRQYIPQRSEKLKGTLRIDFPIKVAPFSGSMYLYKGDRREFLIESGKYLTF
jgi:hypothetical protein